MKNGVSDRTMQRWWRLAVLANNYCTCAVCGAIRTPDELECHHLIKRRYRILRNDFRNGVCVCAGECHRKADNNSGWLIQKSAYREHLTKTTSTYTTVKDFLIDEGITQKEFDRRQLAELKKIAKGMHDEFSD